MKEKIKRFQGLVEDKVWIPLTATMIDGHNLAIVLSKGEDESYCKAMALEHDILVPLYVDSGGIDIDIFNRFFVVFVYVIEQKMNLSPGEQYISAYKVFEKIKKHWHDLD